MTDRSGQDVAAALIAAVNAHDLDAIVDQFNQSQPKKLSPHLVWRLVATLAK